MGSAPPPRNTRPTTHVGETKKVTFQRMTLVYCLQKPVYIGYMCLLPPPNIWIPKPCLWRPNLPNDIVRNSAQTLNALDASLMGACQNTSLQAHGITILSLRAHGTLDQAIKVLVLLLISRPQLSHSSSFIQDTTAFWHVRLATTTE